MKKLYNTPNITKVYLSLEDIMSASDGQIGYSQSGGGDIYNYGEIWVK